MRRWTDEEIINKYAQVENSRNMAEIAVSHPPFRVRIEPTNLCNLRCTSCPNIIKKPKELGFMEIEEFKRIVDQVAKFEYRARVTLYLGGEPLLHKKIIEMIGYAAQHNISTDFNTNGALLTEELAENLLNSEIETISFSFDDMPPEQYEALRKNSIYEKTLQNICYFLKRKQELWKEYPFVYIESLAIYAPSSDVGFDIHTPPIISQEFVNLFDGLRVDGFSKSYIHSWAGGYEIVNGEISCDGNKESDYVRHRQKKAPRCILPWKEMVINFKGDVVACCYDLGYECILGNVEKTPLLEI
jgi:MoaA/NifB/PqqE/SkfB family radical SAM enzyme